MTNDETGVGSENWTENAALQGDEQLYRAEKFKKAFSGSALLSIASNLRDSVSCTLDESFSIGQFNFVKKITFEDEVQWIARMRMPVPTEPEHYELSKRERYAMSSEIATMEYISENTTIPIPKIHHYSLDTEEIGVPYVLMDYVHGNVADETAASMGSPDSVPGEHEESFIEQYAEISAQLSSLKLPMIGSIVKESGEFRIGPIAETGSGPYETSSNFYEEYPDKLISTYYGSEATPSQRKLSDAFKRFAKGLPHLLTGEMFRLVNFDLAPNNIVVDKDFNILAVIDWDAVMAVPESLIYQFPPLMGIDIGLPGQDINHPSVVERLERSHRFAAITERVYRENQLSWMNKTGFYSREVAAFRALMNYQSESSEWVAALEYMEDKTDEDVERFYQQPGA